jgi:TatD DNase family protein
MIYEITLNIQITVFVDSHAHIDGPEFDLDREDVIQRARDAGVGLILNVGTGDPHSGALERAVELAESNENVFAAIGTHPHDARLFDSNAEQRIINLLHQSKRIIAWGEIGLDFHYDNSPREVQCEAFRRQVKLARSADLPIIIHSRAAEEETIDILRSEWVGANRQGVMHCFTGSAGLAAQCVELGFLISFSGILTFKSASDLRAIAAEVPLDRLLIETDCPYLAPIPFRGKRNEPAYVVEVARCLSEVRNIAPEELAQITTANFSRVFSVK